jgi:predicted nuclease of predicted toxin-antitoxin system
VSELFAKLYLDEDVSALLAKLVRARGFDAMTTLDARNIASTDELQLSFASSVGRVLLTHNRVDFEQLASRWHSEGRQHAGILIAVRRKPHDMLQRILPILNRLSAEELVDQVLYL